MKFKVVIPARYASTRLPAKPLADIGGKPMVAWVAERAGQSGAEEVWVATDHADVQKAAEAHDLKVLMTSASHPTGTDRIAEVAGLRDWPDEAIVVNVQGDEPLIDPQLIRDVAADLHAHPLAAIATACHPIHERGVLFNPNVVKVVSDRDGYALYFSRAPIPWARDAFARDEFPADLPVSRHIGIYAYRVSFLKQYGQLSQAPIEQFEALEQLRALWHGYRISVLVTDRAPAAGVDTPEDLERVRQILA